jgi:hypothetical protein
MENVSDLPPQQKAQKLLELGRKAFDEGHTLRAHSFVNQSMGIFEQLGDRRGMARAMLELGLLAMHYNPSRTEGPFERRERLCAEALRLFRELEDRRGIVRALLLLAEEALALYRDLGQKRHVAEMLMFLTGRVNGAPDLACDTAYCEEGLAICREIGISEWQDHFLQKLADIAEAQGDPDRARRLRTEAKGLALVIDPEMVEALKEVLEAASREGSAEPLRKLFFP